MARPICTDPDRPWRQSRSPLRVRSEDAPETRDRGRASSLSRVTYGFRGLGEMLLLAGFVIFGEFVAGGYRAFEERLGLASIPVVFLPPAALDAPCSSRIAQFLIRLRSMQGEPAPLI